VLFTKQANHFTGRPYGRNVAPVSSTIRNDYSEERGPPLIRKRHRPDSLGELDLFAACSRAELQRVEQLITPVHLPAGRVLMREGTIGHEFIVIAEGDAAVRVEGSVAPLAVIGPGGFVGEMALLNHEPRSATVTAITPLSIFVSSHREFDELLRAVPSISEKITSASQERRARNKAA
jgi:CRP-like cAMP-binding protein